MTNHRLHVYAGTAGQAQLLSYDAGLTKALLELRYSSRLLAGTCCAGRTNSDAFRLCRSARCPAASYALHSLDSPTALIDAPTLPCTHHHVLICSWLISSVKALIQPAYELLTLNAKHWMKVLLSCLRLVLAPMKMLTRRLHHSLPYELLLVLLLLIAPAAVAAGLARCTTQCEGCQWALWECR